ncbi:MAG TPA: acyltransferase [Azospira sp.]|nr:acyltransferase [Azospira sp.]
MSPAPTEARRPTYRGGALAADGVRPAPAAPAADGRPGARVNELDLLRFLAALAVVLFHYAFRGYAADGLSPMPYPLLAPLARYGYLGVDLFFLISGFVILMSAAGGGLRQFVVSRAVRLYPAFWACCTLSFVAIVAFGGERFSATPGQYLLNLTLLGGFLGVPPIDGVYWSLFVEMKFYALVAIVLVAGLMPRVQTLLVLWLAATCALAVLPVGILRALLIADYAPYFIAGALCYLVWAEGPSPLRLGGIAVAWLLALYQSMTAIDEFARHYQRELDGRVIAGTITVFFAGMLLIATRRTGRLGRRRWLTLGALTYPLYLLHQKIGYLIFNAAYPALDAHLVLWGTLLLMLLAAYAVHVLVERRLGARLKRLLTAPRPAPLARAPRAS